MSSLSAKRLEPGNAATVFVVDDDPAVRESLQVLLRSCGYHVEAYSSARAFMHAYRDTPGCLLLDVCMPGLSGLDLQDWLITKRSSIPVIIITGEHDRATQTDALLAGALAYLRKPIDAKTLLSHIERAIRAPPSGAETASGGDGP